MFYFGSKKAGRRREMTAASSQRPKLEQRNASKKIDYDASWASTSSDDSPALADHSFDLSPAAYSDKTSFRIGGSFEGEVDLLYRSLGLSGPEDFAIPAAAWEASLKSRSCDLVIRSRFSSSESSPKSPENPISTSDRSAEPPRAGHDEPVKISRSSAGGSGSGDGGIKGTRPPALNTNLSLVSVLSPSLGRSALAPPPVMKLRVLDKTSSAWDLVRSFAPPDENEEGDRRRSFDSDGEEKGEVGKEGTGDGEAMDAVGEMGVISGQTLEDSAGSFSTSNDDDSSSTTTESVFLISPNGRLKGITGSWMRGQLLGGGSFGTVYEGISDDGRFFAVKEVSLLDKGRSDQQSILQLEQEIALLSQFEHENIVQYYGTDKEESKLFIFLELVTQGSLASLYQKYQLRDTQVSAYTRQILNGLQYLHDKNVVHRYQMCQYIGTCKWVC